MFCSKTNLCHDIFNYCVWLPSMWDMIDFDDMVFTNLNKHSYVVIWFYRTKLMRSLIKSMLKLIENQMEKLLGIEVFKCTFYWSFYNVSIAKQSVINVKIIFNQRENNQYYKNSNIKYLFVYIKRVTNKFWDLHYHKLWTLLLRFY